LEFKFKGLVSLTIFLFLTASTFLSKADVTPILLYGKNIVKPSTLSVEYYVDKDNSATIHEISSGKFDEFFTNKQEDFLQEESKVIWVRMQMYSPNLDFFIATINDFQYQVAHYYLNSSQEYVVEYSGLSVPFEDKNLKTTYPSFYIYPTTTPEYHYFKITRICNDPISFTFTPLKTFNSTIQGENFMFGLMIGIAILFAVYVFTLYLRLGNRLYLIIFFYVTSYGVYLSTVKLFLFRYFHFFTYADCQVIQLFYSLPTAFMLITLLLIPRYIFERNNKKFIYIRLIFLILAGLRVIILFIEIFINPLFSGLEIDLFFFCIAFVLSFYISIVKRNNFMLIYTSVVLSVGFSFWIQFLARLTGKESLFSINYLNVSIAFSLLGLAVLGFMISQLIKTMQMEITRVQALRLQELMEKEKLKDKLNKELHELVEQRTREINKKTQELDTFIYKTSHDIRGPLKSIIGIAEITALKPMSVEEYKDYFAHVKSSATKLDNTISDFLNILKARHLQINMVDIDFKALIDEVLENLQFHKGLKEIEINTKIYNNIGFASDYSAFVSIFQNLIENAILFRDRKKPKSTLDIKIFPYGDTIKIIFSDNGIGIAEHDQKVIFNLLHEQTPSLSKTGLGLYIVRLLTENLGGNIEIRSKQNEGTTFVLTFKYKQK
jgi:signal transduction histidine kinase